MNNRPTYLQIDLIALMNNYEYLKKVSNKEVFAVVKANAYGHGMIGISKFFNSIKCAYICVSSLDEAYRLRTNGISSPILVLGYVDLSQEFVDYSMNNNITLSAVSIDWFNELISYNFSPNLKLHIEVDTGMNRLGIKDFDEVECVVKVSSSLGICVEGIYTHFHSSDKDDGSLQKQYIVFKNIVNSLNFTFKWIHTANSDAVYNLEDDISNAIRPGLALYGYSSAKLDLQPIMTFHSRVVQRKLVLKDQTVSYGATYTALENTWIGVIPVGYADGLPFELSNNFNVYLGDVSCPVIGRICMDQLMIKIPKNNPNDYVTIVGIENDFETIAKLTNTITYEILTGLNSRIHRIFVSRTKVVYEE